MKKTLSALAIGSLIFAAIITLVWFNFYKIAVFAAKKAAGVEIRYAALFRQRGGWLEVRGLDVFDAKRGGGLSCEYGTIRASWKITAPEELGLHFKLNKVRFKGKGGPPEGEQDSISRLLVIPFENQLEHEEASGALRLQRGRINVDEFRVTSDDIKVSSKGWINDKDEIDVAMDIYFSKKALEAMPTELADAIVKRADDDWGVFSARLKGNYKIPSIEVSNKKFILRIRAQ